MDEYDKVAVMIVILEKCQGMVQLQTYQFESVS